MLAERYRLLVRLGLMLIAGFLAVSLGAFWVSRDSLRNSLIDEALPLTGDNIYSEIQKDILRPVFISSLMAHDTFLRDWVLSGEHDVGQLTRYLREIKEKYGTLTTFFVSVRSANYYHPGGVLKQVRPDEPRDVWFYRVRHMSAPYELNVDPDLAHHDTRTIFINYRVLDYDGNFIGAAGVGLPLALVAKQIETYEKRFHRRIYFIGHDGRVVLSSADFRHEGRSIREMPGIRAIAESILQHNAQPVSLEYALGNATVLVNARHIPELDWHLIVEQGDSEAMGPVHQALLLNLGIAVLVTLFVLITVLLAVNRYQRRLEAAVATDSLTGAINRQAFDIIFKLALGEAQRNDRPLSVILVDVDLFKQINDTYGHLAGDAALRIVASVLRGQLREIDVIARWGGEEFLVLLKGCPLNEAVAVAEKLRHAIAEHDFAVSGEGDRLQRLSISLGVSTRAAGDTQDSLFFRADRALYLAKHNGRNRVEVAET